VLVESGVLQGFLYNTYAARRAGTTSTASAVRAGFKSGPGVGARALSVVPGSKSPDEILHSIGSGLLVQSISGVHSGVNPVSGDFSVGAEGMLFKDGVLSEPVREITIASTLRLTGPSRRGGRSPAGESKVGSRARTQPAGSCSRRRGSPTRKSGRACGSSGPCSTSAASTSISTSGSMSPGAGVKCPRPFGLPPSRPSRPSPSMDTTGGRWTSCWVRLSPWCRPDCGSCCRRWLPASCRTVPLTSATGRRAR